MEQAITLSQWLANFPAVASPVQVQQVAQTLAQQLTGGAADFDPANAAAYLRALAEVRPPEFALLSDRPMSDFLPAERTPAPDDKAVTWAGRHTHSLLGYVAATTAAHVFRRHPAADYYRPTDERMARSLERYEYQVYDENPDPAERREAFGAEHAGQLDWAARHAETLLRAVPSATRGVYDVFRVRVGLANETYRQLMDERDALVRETSRLSAHDQHDQNVRINDEEIRIDAAIDALEKRIYEIEAQWQLFFYNGLMDAARAHVRKPTARQEAAVAAALNRFETAAAAEIAYRDRLLAGEKDATPSKRKSLEEAAYRALMHDGNKSLHETVRSVLEDIGHPAADSLTAPLSFVWKEQVFRHAQGPADQVAMERLVETIIPFSGEIKAAKKAAKKDLAGGRESLDHIAAREWAVPLLADFFETFRLGAPAGVFSLSDIPPEALNIRGALAVFGPNDNPLAPQNGIVTDQTHGDTMDYAAIFASRYLFWGRNRRRPSIVAESIFKRIPYMGPVLEVTTGGFLSRDDKQKRERFLNETLPERIKEGRDVAQFGEGTRRLGNAFVSRYSDLRHPGALHAPGEFLSPGAMRGMQFRLALANKADVHLYAAKIHPSGSGEPSIPREIAKGFGSAHYTSFGYRPPKKQNGFVAYAGVIRYEDMIHPEDFPGEPPHKILARNVAIDRRKLRQVGMTMDAGPRVG